MPKHSRDISGLSPLWLMSLAMVLAIFLLTAIPLLISSNSIDSSAWLGYTGYLISASIAAAGILVASTNVRSQLRVNLFSREEERIERQLPGLREIAGALYAVHIPVDSKSPQRIFELLAPFMNKEFFIDNECVKRHVPLADDQTRQTFQILLQMLLKAAADFTKLEATDDPSSGNIGKNVRLLNMMTCQHEIKEFEKSIHHRIDVYEQRSRAIRKELDQYFDTERLS